MSLEGPIPFPPLSSILAPSPFTNASSIHCRRALVFLSVSRKNTIETFIFVHILQVWVRSLFQLRLQPYAHRGRGLISFKRDHRAGSCSCPLIGEIGFSGSRVGWRSIQKKTKKNGTSCAIKNTRKVISFFSFFVLIVKKIVKIVLFFFSVFLLFLNKRVRPNKKRNLKFINLLCSFLRTLESFLVITHQNSFCAIEGVDRKQ